MKARLSYRSLAFLLDVILLFAFLMLVSQWIAQPEALRDTQTFIESLKQALENGQTAEAFLVNHPLTPALDELITNLFSTLFLSLWIYFGPLEWLMGGATLGKRVFHLRNWNPLRLTPPNLIESLLRGSLKTLSLLALFNLPILIQWLDPFALLALDYLWAWFHPQSRTLHDLLARTTVVEPSDPRLLEEIA